MATTVIHDACEAGALAGFMSNRGNFPSTAAANATLIALAKAVADEFITVNAASGAAIADADKASIGPIVQAAAQGICDGRCPLVTGGAVDTTAVDYVGIATQIYAVAAEAKAVGGLT